MHQVAGYNMQPLPSSNGQAPSTLLSVAGDLESLAAKYPSRSSSCIVFNVGLSVGAAVDNQHCTLARCYSGYLAGDGRVG